MDDSEFIYTAHTKWNVPLLVIHNYKCGNTNDMLHGDFILEIIEGNLLFNNPSRNISTGECIGCDVIFRLEFEGLYQLINMRYIYESEREPIYTYDLNSLEAVPQGERHDSVVDSYLTVNTQIKMKVNRTGEYNLFVKAYDMYNNIFFNKADDYVYVRAKYIYIDTILNQYHMVNEKTFNKNNLTGTLLTLEEKQQLFLDISTNNSMPLTP